MNARFLERLIKYREERGLIFTRTVLIAKIRFQFAHLKSSAISKTYVDNILNENEKTDLLLIEARAARKYWKLFKEKLKIKDNFSSRNYRHADPVNKLLNIGYHHAFNLVDKQCLKLSFPTELGFFHKAQTSKSKPFVYDFVEWLRPFLIERVLISFLNKKKKPLNKVSELDIKKFLYKINKEWKRKYFHSKLDYCITLEYWNQLLLQELIRAINNSEDFNPKFPSLRHENRCNKN